MLKNKKRPAARAGKKKQKAPKLRLVRGGRDKKLEVACEREYRQGPFVIGAREHMDHDVCATVVDAWHDDENSCYVGVLRFDSVADRRKAETEPAWAWAVYQDDGRFIAQYVEHARAVETVSRYPDSYMRPWDADEVAEGCRLRSGHLVSCEDGFCGTARVERQVEAAWEPWARLAAAQELELELEIPGLGATLRKHESR